MLTNLSQARVVKWVHQNGSLYKKTPYIYKYNKILYPFDTGVPSFAIQASYLQNQTISANVDFDHPYAQITYDVYIDANTKTNYTKIVKIMNNNSIELRDTTYGDCTVHLKITKASSSQIQISPIICKWFRVAVLAITGFSILALSSTTPLKSLTQTIPNESLFVEEDPTNTTGLQLPVQSTGFIKSTVIGYQGSGIIHSINNLKYYSSMSGNTTAKYSNSTDWQGNPWWEYCTGLSSYAAEFYYTGTKYISYSIRRYNSSSLPCTVYYSDDGVTWLQCTSLTANNHSLRAFDVSDNLFVCLTSSSSTSVNVYYSTDGITWVKSTLPSYSSTTSSSSDTIIAYSSASKSWALKAYGTSYISNDGKKWTKLSGYPSSVQDTLSTSTTHIVITSNNEIYSSTDRISWQLSNYFGGTIYSKVAVEGLFVVTTTDNKIYSSTDGAEWTLYTPYAADGFGGYAAIAGPDNTIICYNPHVGGGTMATGKTYLYYRSANTAWVSVTKSVFLMQMAHANGTFLAVDGNYKIRRFTFSDIKSNNTGSICDAYADTSYVFEYVSGVWFNGSKCSTDDGITWATNTSLYKELTKLFPGYKEVH